MANDLKLELELTATDNASTALKKASKELEKSLNQAGVASEKSGKTQEKAANQSAQATIKAAKEKTKAELQANHQKENVVKHSAQVESQLNQRAANYAKSLAESKRRLGIRTERDIQAEIKRSERAYQKLAQSGKASANDLKRAWGAHREQLKRLQAEMKTMPANGSLGVGGMGTKLASGMATGYMALQGAKNALMPAMNDAKLWEQNVASVALMAFGDKDANYIKTEGKKQINDSVLNTVSTVGGTHDQVLELFNAMMANGMDFQQAKAMLPEAQKMAIAGEANSADMGALIKVLSDYGFKGEDLTRAFEHAIRSGMDGKFEIKDMVSALPDLLSKAKQVGFTGLKDFDFLLGTLQSAANKSGSNDTAANNVANLIEKSVANDTHVRLGKLEHPKVKGKGIDWNKTIEEEKAKGNNAVQALMNLVDMMLAQDKSYQKLQQKLAKATTEQEKQQLQSQLDLKKGIVLSRIMPDVQAKAGLTAATDKQAVEGYMVNSRDPNLTNNLIGKRVDVMMDTAKAQEEKRQSQDFLNNSFAKWAVEQEKQVNIAQNQFYLNNPEQASWLANSKMALEMAGGAGVYGGGAWLATKGLGLGGAGGMLKNAGSFTRAGMGAAVGAGTGAVSGLGAVASGAAGLAAIGATVHFLAGARTDQQIQQELRKESAEDKAETEKKNAFYQQAYGSSAQSVWAQAGALPVSVGATKTGNAPLYGGYALGAVAENQALADERLARGLISQEAYQARSVQNQSLISEIQTGGAADGMAQLGQVLSESLSRALSGRENVIQNQISLQIDGRTVAESVADFHYKEMVRG